MQSYSALDSDVAGIDSTEWCAQRHNPTEQQQYHKTNKLQVWDAHRQQAISE